MPAYQSPDLAASRWCQWDTEPPSHTWNKLARSSLAYLEGAEKVLSFIRARLVESKEDESPTLDQMAAIANAAGDVSRWATEIDNAAREQMKVMFGRTESVY